MSTVVEEEKPDGGRSGARAEPAKERKHLHARLIKSSAVRRAKMDEEERYGIGTWFVM